MREQHFSERDRRAADKGTSSPPPVAPILYRFADICTNTSINTAFVAESNAEMQLKQEFAQVEADKAERLRAAKSVASTPRIAGVGTPVVKRTPRRFGF